MNHKKLSPKYTLRTKLGVPSMLQKVVALCSEGSSVQIHNNQRCHKTARQVLECCFNYTKTAHLQILSNVSIIGHPTIRRRIVQVTDSDIK